MSLHEYMTRFAEYKSNGNTTEYDRILSEMLESEKINAEMSGCTHVTTNSGGVMPLAPTGWMSYVTSYSPPTYDQNGNIVGFIQNWNNISGQNPDGNYALLWINSWDGIKRTPAHGGEAFASGAVWNGQTGWLNGYISIYAYTSIPSWDNYVIISVYDGSTWHYLSPEHQVHNTSPTWVYMGYTSIQFTQIAVECWTPPPYPIPYSPLIKNYVFIDSVRIVKLESAWPSDK